jgi:putative endonuclease
MDCFVYVLGCRLSKTRHLTYVGWTNDVARRLSKHNTGKGARTTRGRFWILLHVESYETRRQAMIREWHLKRDRKFRKHLATALPARPAP